MKEAVNWIEIIIDENILRIGKGSFFSIILHLLHIVKCIEGSINEKGKGVEI